MTQQYIAGEVSVLLGELQLLAGTQTTARDTARLRYHAETVPVPALAAIAARALQMIEAECWESLTRGDTAAFARQAALGARLHLFGTCAGFRLDLAS